MKENYEYMSCDQAIEKLQKMKKKNPKCKVMICTVDFEKDSVHQKITTPDEGCLIVRRSKTVVVNEDMYVPHMQCFSKSQNIENILREGLMHDIIFAVS